MNKIGSSETIRKTTFKSFSVFNFSNYAKNTVSHKNKINSSFLEWFIGFAERDTSFIVSTNRLFFIINQKEKKVLHTIRTNLGFGKISTHKTYSRYIVADQKNIDRLISIFNGNLVLNKTNSRFVLWLNSRNMYSTEKIQYLNKNELRSFKDNAWLSGFIDAEGCFNAIKILNKNYTLGYKVKLRFILNQKNEKHVFYKIQNFLESGGINKHKQIENMFRFTSTSIISHEKLINYLRVYPLRSLKKVEYVRFSSLLNYIKNNQTLPWENKVLKKVENLIKNLNSKS